MKTLKISDDVHQKLTALLGELTAQTMKMQTYQDAIEALLTQSVIIPPELLKEVESFINKNKHLGYTSKEEFVRDAIRFRLQWLGGEYEYFEIPKQTLEKMDIILDYLPNTMKPHNAREYINKAIDEAIQQLFEACDEAKKHRWNEKTIKEVEERLREIDECWERRK